MPLQLALLSYQFYLVRSANLQHMKRFSVFLALPSAALRIMATRQMAVGVRYSHFDGCLSQLACLEPLT